MALALSAADRVLVSTDIGGTDPDDFQSMVHLLLYADVLDIEGLISSPYGPGRKEHILEVIAKYEQDYPALLTHSRRYPSPGELRAITKQGAIESGPWRATEGSNWIIECARKPDLRPLNVLVWGGLEDVAQALHDAPDILPKLRVYFIGGPNKMWSVDAYHYIEQNHPKLWMIENNSTYRGWFTGGDQNGKWGNAEFVKSRLAGRGALGEYFATHLKGVIKMGDSPSVGWLLANWGGTFVPVWDGRRTVFSRWTKEADKAEAFGVVEWAIPVPKGMSASDKVRLWIDNRIPAVGVREGNVLRFRFSPRDAKVWPFVVQSDFAGLNGQRGAFTAVMRTGPPSRVHPNWQTDDPAPAAAEGVHTGAKHVSRYRAAFLEDFAQRMERTQPLAARQRVVVLTDIENEPDDTQSMVRFLVSSSQWDVEGLIATTSVHQRNRTAPEKIRELVNAYKRVRTNLLRHEAGYPTVEHLLSVLKEGRADFGMAAVGEGKDSPGSEHLIDVVDRADDRPVWVLVWGGPNCLAQALWKVKQTRTAAELTRFVARLRVYTISDQDDSGPWLRKTFPDLFYIASPGIHAPGGYHHATWSGISGDRFHGRFAGADFSIVDNPWLDVNVRAKGPLGELYPQTKFLMEGDTPSFLYLMPNGLGDPEHPNWGSWGGRYEFYTPPYRRWHQEPETRPFWADAEDEAMGIDGQWHSGNHVTIWRWREAYQNEFAARMDWTVKEKANHAPVPVLALGGELRVRSGEKVELGAEASSDPDGDALEFRWLYYPEPSTVPISNARTPLALAIANADQPRASFVAPKVSKPGVLHIVLEVRDKGTPRLTRYRRVRVTVEP